MDAKTVTKQTERAKDIPIAELRQMRTQFLVVVKDIQMTRNMFVRQNLYQVYKELSELLGYPVLSMDLLQDGVPAPKRA